MTQLNTPYPATAQLTGYLRSRGFAVQQADLALELFLRLYSAGGLERLAGALTGVSAAGQGPAVQHFVRHARRYGETIDRVIAFLQGKDPTFGYRVVQGGVLPEGRRFGALDPELLESAFGALGVQDRAKYLASLYLDEIGDAIREGVDPRFQFARYGEKLAASAPSFGPLRAALEAAAPTLVDRAVDELALEALERHDPSVVAISAPFAGNVYGAFRIARAMKKARPDLVLVLGGGYVNTELRELSEPAVFDYFDYVTLDDGERPLELLLRRLERSGRGGGGASDPGLLRTFHRVDGRVRFEVGEGVTDLPHREVMLCYDGLPLERYVSILEMLNPMHRIWSDGRWIKLAVAHGCYWRKCNFCDVTLDYIGRYDAASASAIVDRMEKLMVETGQSGFHFVDEAAPPALLKAISEELLRRRLTVTWWGNIRFEKTFTPELAELMARAGCVAVSGGLEVASDRLLELMRKGVTVEQVARVTRGFADAGILVHAYLMYGFPTQTEQETVDSLERVRQLFAEGCLQSAFWHRFAATVHSPIGRAPEKFGIRLRPRSPVTFASNDLEFDDPTGCDHEALGEGLRRAVYNYMVGAGLDLDVRQWFDHPVPKAKVPKRLVAQALKRPH